jgi:tetratricopeptide (TPR) repeat protein
MDIAAHLERAMALQRDGHLEEAVALYDEVLVRQPGNADATYCLGLIDLNRGRFDDAERRFASLVNGGFDNARVLNAMGVVTLARGRYREALHWHDRALAADPEFPEAHVNRGLMLLRAGHYPEGFAEFEWRWRIPWRRPAPRDPQRLLTAATIAAGRTVLIHAEQGLGDMIQFARYLGLLRERGMTIVLEVQPELVGLLDESGCADWVIAQGDPLPDYDLHCPVATLPLVFGTTAQSIPATVPYLCTDAERDRHWSEVLGRSGPRVGLVWGGNPNNPTDAERSTTLAELDSLTTVHGIRWFSLQKGPQTAMLALHPQWRAMVDLAPRLTDFRETASALRCLDLVITVDTAVAHLAGALAVPAWLLVQKPCDWRWQEAGERTAWYPSMRIFRQDEPRCWAPVVSQVRAALAQFVDDSKRNSA